MPDSRQFEDWEIEIIRQAAKDKAPFLGTKGSLLARLRHEGQRRGKANYTPGFTAEEADYYTKKAGTRYSPETPTRTPARPTTPAPAQKPIPRGQDTLSRPRPEMIGEPITSNRYGDVVSQRTGKVIEKSKKPRPAKKPYEPKYLPEKVGRAVGTYVKNAARAELDPTKSPIGGVLYGFPGIGRGILPPQSAPVTPEGHEPLSDAWLRFQSGTGEAKVAEDVYNILKTKKKGQSYWDWAKENPGKVGTAILNIGLTAAPHVLKRLHNRGKVPELEEQIAAQVEKEARAPKARVSPRPPKRETPVPSNVETPAPPKPKARVRPSRVPAAEEAPILTPETMTAPPVPTTGKLRELPPEITNALPPETRREIGLSATPEPSSPPPRFIPPNLLPEGPTLPPSRPAFPAETVPTPEPRPLEPTPAPPLSPEPLSPEPLPTQPEAVPEPMGAQGFPLARDVYDVPTEAIVPDPERFQYKLDTGKGGVTRKYDMENTPYDPSAAGTVLLWKDPETGIIHPINGHHRREWADIWRLKGMPEAQTMRAEFSTAKTAAQARAQGALRNIQEGQGTAVDAAKFLRDTGLTPDDLRAQGVSLRSGLANDGLALSNLSDQLWYHLTTSGQLPEKRAITIAKTGLAAADQDILWKAVQDGERIGKKITDGDIVELATDLQSGPKITETQGGLFGEEEVTRSLSLEKAQLASYLREQLAKEKRTFGNVSKDSAAAILGEEGNVIDVGRNAARSDQAKTLLEVYGEMRKFKGPLNDLLDDAAARMAAGEPEANVKKALLQDARETLQAFIRGGEGLAPQGLPGSGGSGIGSGGTAPDAGAEAVPPVPTEAERLAAGQSPLFGDEAGGIDALGAPERQDMRLPPNGLPFGRRIDVAPLSGGEPKRLSKIQLDLNRALGKRVRVGKTGRGVAGSYYPGNARTVIGLSNDLDSDAHEIAHALDDQFGIVGQWVNDPQSPFDAELIPHFSQHGSPIPPRYQGSQVGRVYERAEAVAEWVRAFIVNPQAAEAAAPNFAAHFKASLTPEVETALRTFSDDVRKFAGLPGSKRILSNVRTGMEKTSTLQKAREYFGGDGYSFETTGIDVMKSRLLDDLFPVMKGIKGAKEIQGIGSILPTKDPETLMRLHAGALDKIQTILDDGPIHADGTPVAGLQGGFSKLLEPFDHSSPEALRRDMNDTLAYMIAQRTFFEAQTGNAGRSFTGSGGGLTKDIYDAMDTLREFGSDPSRLAKVDAGAKAYRDWGNWLLTYLKDKGRISEASYNTIKQENPFYVDMHRVFDDAEGLADLYEDAARRMNGETSRKFSSVKQPIQAFRGSAREIEDPYVNLMKQTYLAVAEADRNEAVRAFTDLLRSDRGIYAGPVKALSEIGHEVAEGTTGAVKVFVNGNPEHWRFESGINEALNRWGNMPDGNLMTSMASFMRNSITHSPAFIVRNIIRDTINRSVISNVGSTPWETRFFGLGDDAAKLSLSGGGQAGHYMRDAVSYHDELARVMKQEANNPNVTILSPEWFGGKGRMALEKYGDLTKQSEVIGRVAEYRKAYDYAVNTLKYGEQDARLYAAYQARDLLDFAVAGTWIRGLNRYVPFTNAALQGLRRTGRAAAANPKAFLAAWSVYVLAPSLFEYMWNAKDPDTLAEYRQLPDYRRDFFWNFKMGGRWFAIPRPFELGVFGSGVTRAIDRYAAGNEEGMDGWIGSAARSLLPVDDTALLGGPLANRPAAEVTSNYDLFRGRPIIPPYEADLDPEMRKGRGNASRLGQAVDALLPNAIIDDPRKIDHLIKGYFGGLGQGALNLSDLGREDRDTGYLLGGTFTGLMGSDPVYTSKDVQAVFSMARKYRQSGSGEVKGLRSLMDRYSEATKPKEKDALRQRIFSTAQRLKVDLERQHRNRVQLRR